MNLFKSAATLGVSTLLCGYGLPSALAAGPVRQAPAQHVLLLSVDGLHGLDLANYVKSNPKSALGQLAAIGIVYSNASSAMPSDSFPGLLAMITGGSPVSTGVWYDVSYDRALSPPGSMGPVPGGTVVAYDSSIDKNPDAVDGGGIDPTKLPVDCKWVAAGCTPVYPHEYLQVNTIFEVAKTAGLRTAWADKHPSYEIVNGPSGSGVDDLFTPEIDAGGTTKSVAKTEAYDDTKVQAILNQIDGKDHTGAQTVGVPAIFGMNFQAVSVGQKLAGSGYSDGAGTPSTSLKDALDHTDASIGKMVAELKAKGLTASTLVIVTAKHGQSPIDPSKRKIVDEATIPGLVDAVSPKLLSHATQDSISLLWLKDSSRTDAVAAKLATNQDVAGIQEILTGEALKLRFEGALDDSRSPDLVVLPNLGVIYAGATSSKIAEHGGFSPADTHVALLLSHPGLTSGVIKSPVQTVQIAPTILEALGLDPNALNAVISEKTRDLPGLASAGIGGSGVMGDLDGDGGVNLKDATLLLRKVVGL